jgi:prefoldin subunit 5
MNISIEEMPREIARLEDENERLNNIINELEKGVSEAIKQLETLKYIDKYRFTYDREFQKVIDKLKELKGSDKE